MADATPVAEGGDGGSEGPARREDGLPTNFDVVIVGTGLVESIVSAAVSRNGHTVLHVDPRDYYGGIWATFGLDQWISACFMEAPVDVENTVNLALSDNPKYGAFKWKNHVSSFEQNWYLKDGMEKDEIMKQKRRFNIDLLPKLIAAREDIVQLLIKSNVSRYLEFLRITRLLTNLPPPNEKTIEPIPLSRADIFTSKSLSLVEKRSLVKLIEAVLKSQKLVTSNEEEDESIDDSVPDSGPETFDELVQNIKVSDKIKHLLKSSITTLEDGFSPNGEKFNTEFCSRCRLFLNSIGRYGNQTPFLWTLYGISEICQAFCRLSAVYGGIFILKRQLSEIKETDGAFQIRMGEDDVIKAKHIIIGPDLDLEIPTKPMNPKEKASIQVGRAVLVTKGGNMKAPDDNPKVKGDGIFVYRVSNMEIIEMNHNSQAVPKDYRLVHVSFPLTEETSESYCRKLIEDQLSEFLDFNPTSLDSPPSTDGGEGDASIEAALNETNAQFNKPKVVYGSYYILNFSCSSVSSELLTISSETQGKCHILESNVASIDLSTYVAKAQEIFSAMFPDEEFLPRAPDCDEQEEKNGDDEETIEIPTSDNTGAGEASNANAGESSGGDDQRS